MKLLHENNHQNLDRNNILQKTSNYVINKSELSNLFKSGNNFSVSFGKTTHTNVSQTLYKSVQESTADSTTVHACTLTYNASKIEMHPRQDVHGFENSKEFVKKLNEFLGWHRAQNDLQNQSNQSSNQ